MTKLKEKKVAILATDGFEQSELTQPLHALQSAGATVHIVSLKAGKIKGWSDGNWGDEVAVDVTMEEAKADNYNGLVLPGGVLNPDRLRTESSVQTFVRDFFKAGKPVAAICHGPWTLIDAQVVEGRQMTSYHSIKTDLINAGVNWVDKPVVVDQGLVTSRHPGDLDAFCAKIVEEIAEGVHEEQKESV